MKKIYLLLTFLLSITISNAQIDSTKIAFVSYWSVGDSYDFKITKIMQQWKEGIQTKNQKSEYIANFKVIDSTANSYTIRWSYEIELENTYNIPKELLDRFSKYKLMEVEYKTSEVGDFIEVINWQEVGENMNNMFDEIINVLGEKDKKKNEIFKEIYQTKQGIEQLVIKELQYFHFPMGIEFDITEPLYYDEELPNMFGGKPIKGKVKLYFENVDFEKSFCVLKQEMDLDPDDTKKLLSQVFKKMNFDNRKIKKALKSAVFEIKDRNVYEYYYNPGIPHKIETVRESIIDIDNEKGKRIDKIIIELVYYE